MELLTLPITGRGPSCIFNFRHPVDVPFLHSDYMKAVDEHVYLKEGTSEEESNKTPDCLFLCGNNCVRRFFLLVQFPSTTGNGKQVLVDM